MRGLAVVVAAIVLASAGAASAQAHDQAAAQKTYDDGRALYSAGDYRGAADKFRLAYDRDPDPVYLFNLAQADRFGKLCRDAADAYRRFLAAAPSAPNRDKVEHYVDEMEACARSQVLAEPSPTPPTEPVTAPPTETAPPPPSHAAAEPLAEPFDAGPAPAPHAHRTLTYALAGVGVVALAVAGYFTYDLFDAKSAQSGCTGDPNPCNGKTIRDLDDRGARDNVAVPVTFGIAAVALGASAYLFIHDRRAAEHPIAIAPTRGGAVFTTLLRF